jgi:hypothetical protein
VGTEHVGHTPADIERVKAAWMAIRDKIAARHQQEMKNLEMETCLAVSKVA